MGLALTTRDGEELVCYLDGCQVTISADSGGGLELAVETTSGKARRVGVLQLARDGGRRYKLHVADPRIHVHRRATIGRAAS